MTPRNIRMRAALLILSAALAAAPFAAAAQSVVPLQKFDSVELNGGGTVTIRQGPVQRVTLRHGSADISRLEVRDRGRLVINVCEGRCPFHYDLDVEIETPEIGGASVRGGGDILAQGPFRQQGHVSVAVSGGGKVDLRAIPARAVSAAVQGGGEALVTAQNSLAAAVSGGGSVRYVGQPSLNSAVHGGGSIDQIH